MSSGSYKQVDVVCPFYKHDDGKRRIVCEGLVDSGNISLIYIDKLDYERQISVFCCENYEKCVIYQALLKSKYSDT